MRKVTKLFHFYVEKYIILTSQSVFKKEKKRKKKRRFPVELELSRIPQCEECLLRSKLSFHQELATHTQTEIRNTTSQIRNRETDLDNLLQNSV